METIQSILREETERYAESLRAAKSSGKPLPSYGQIEKELMTAVRARVVRANCHAMRGDPKLSAPSRLGFPQIAEILAASMDLRMVPDGKRLKKLQVRGAKGWTDDLSDLYLAAIGLNDSIGQNTLYRIRDRIMLVLGGDGP